MRESLVHALALRAALVGALIVALPLTAEAQGATPLLDTNPTTRVPTFPFGSFQVNSDTVGTVAAQNDANAVFNMLTGGASPNDPDHLERTGLMYAAIFDNALMARVLLAHNADLNAHDRLGNTALHWAADRGSIDVLQMLLQAHAPVDAQNNQGVTPLMLAVSNSRAGAVKVLLTAGADPHKQDYTGRDALGWTTDNRAIAQLLKTAH